MEQQQVNEQAITQALYAPFPEEMEKSMNLSGVNLKFIPVSEVINRLNKVLGVENWSFEIVSCNRDAIDPDYIVAHARITWCTGEPSGIVIRDGFGGQKIKRTKAGDIVDLGDEFKGAVSDALKKALQQIGLGLYLARTEDAMYADEAYEQPVVQEKQPVKTGGVTPALWETFSGHLSKMDKGEKDALSEWWGMTYPGEKKPTQSSATDAQVENCIAECVRIQLNGEYVNK
jgi:hypothetical protein